MGSEGMVSVWGLYMGMAVGRITILGAAKINVSMILNISRGLGTRTVVMHVRSISSQRCLDSQAAASFCAGRAMDMDTSMHAW